MFSPPLKKSIVFLKYALKMDIGCLPLLVQMPIMIGIFYGIRDFHYVGPANFLWIQSISNPDPM